MAHSDGSARTAPKGKATPPRTTRDVDRPLLTPTIQWILVAVVGLLIVGAIVYFSSDSGGDGAEQTSRPPAAAFDGSARAA
jgi:hypothetical protein